MTLSPKDTWAFGGLRTAVSAPYIAHFTGKRWKRIAVPPLTLPFGGWIRNAVALSRNDIWALLRAGRSYDVLHYDGRTWTIVKTPANFSPYDGLVVRSKNDIWLAGWRPGSSTRPFQPGALHFNGKKWSFVPVGTRAAAISSVTDDGQGGLWALSDSAPTELWHDVNGRWSKVQLANINQANIRGLFHIPGTSTTLGIGTDSSGLAVFVTGRF